MCVSGNDVHGLNLTDEETADPRAQTGVSARAARRGPQKVRNTACRGLSQPTLTNTDSAGQVGCEAPARSAEGYRDRLLLLVHAPIVAGRLADCWAQVLLKP